LLAALSNSCFALEGKPEVGNENRFFAADLGYSAHFGTGQGLRSHIRIEVSFRAPALVPTTLPIRSLIAAAARDDPAVIFADMLRRLETDPLWAREYEDFVRAVSFAGPHEMISFLDALASCRRLAEMSAADIR
jgi:hypothetical protein